MELLKTFNPDNLITFSPSAIEHLVASIESKEGSTFEDIGSTVIIPTSVIVSIKKINLT